MKKSSSILWGVALVAAGIFFALNSLNITNVDVFFKGWWTLFIIVPCAVGLFTERDKTGNIIGLALGTAILTIFGSAFNAVYLLPKFADLYGMPLDTIIALGTKINGNIHNVSTFVLICVAPLNLIKSVTVSLLTMLLYKRVARPLFGIHK